MVRTRIPGAVMARSRSKGWWLAGTLMTLAGVLALAGAAVSGEFAMWLPLAAVWFAIAAALFRRQIARPRRVDPRPAPGDYPPDG